MPRTFNTTGPCDPQYHYMLDPEGRLPGMLSLVEERLYFVLHAPRQTGKTTAMRAFARRLREAGYVAVCASLEISQGFEDPEQAEPLWLEALARAAGRQLPLEHRPPPVSAWQGGAVGSRLEGYLSAWCAAVDRPVVLLLDEADVVRGPALVSLLRQLRAGFSDRAIGVFPTSIVLIGMRDLRDYLTSLKGGVPVNPGSPFNIKERSLSLRTFTLDEVRALYAQHTAETGQVFTEESLARAFYYSGGQPFLVNALARTTVQNHAARGEPVTADHIDLAKEQLVLSRTTHLDALAERLKEPRVARILAAVLAGGPSFEVDPTSDDLLYCLDLGLLKTQPRIEVANPLYREVLARVLSGMTQPDLPERAWIKAGKLDVPLLIDGFFAFWREHAEALADRDYGHYQEVVPHLLFMAWLQKVVNGGGRITREYALGSGRLDLLVEFGEQRLAFEVKRVGSHQRLDSVILAGIEQLGGYLDRLGLNEGWLLVFDPKRGPDWDERLWRREIEEKGRVIHARGG